MTPTSTSYTPPGELTGCTADVNCTQNTINPSELNLWRVIKKNDDGTVDVVSEYVSSNYILIYGQTGYMNVVGALNTIATQYTNSKYVQSTRHIGCSNQVEKCSMISETDCPIDSGYTIDVTLVKEATGSFMANRVNTESLEEYFIANRYFRDDYSNADVKVWGVMYVSVWSGAINREDWIVKSDGAARADGAAIRSILTLKANVNIKSGDGKTVATAYTFE